MKIGEKMGNEGIQSASLINASNVYAAMGEYDMSNVYAYKSLVFAQKNGNRKNIATNYINISDNYFKMTRFDSARDFANKGYSMAVEMNNQEDAGLAMNNLGNAYRGAGEWDLALACYTKANLILEHSYGHPESAMGLAKVFQHQGNADSALYYARHSFQEAVKMETTPDILAAAVFLAEHYQKKNAVDSAYRYLNYVIAAKDSLFSQEKTSQLQALYYEEISRQQKIEQARLEAEEERHNNIQYAVLAVGVICFLVLILLLSRSVIVNEKWISFLGVLGLLLLFEFINLFIHPFLGELTHHSPFLMFLALVVIAAFLIPLHHRVEHSILARLTLKNRNIRLAAARRTMKKLEKIDEDEKMEH